METLAISGFRDECCIAYKKDPAADIFARFRYSWSFYAVFQNVAASSLGVQYNFTITLDSGYWDILGVWRGILTTTSSFADLGSGIGTTTLFQ